MKLNDVPKGTMLNTVVLYMPKRILKLMDGTGLNTQRVIFDSPFIGPGGFWVKVEPKHADKMGWARGRIFPVCDLPTEIVLNWRVLKILKP